MIKKQKLESSNKSTKTAAIRINRFTNSQQEITTNIYTMINEQSKKAFSLMWWLSIASAAMFNALIILSVVMAFMGLYEFMALLGSIGGVGGIFVATMTKAGSSLHTKSIEQLNSAQTRLLSVAQIMCLGYTDEERRQ